VWVSVVVASPVLADPIPQPVRSMTSSAARVQSPGRIAVLLPMSGRFKTLGRSALEGLAWGLDAAGLPLKLEVYDTAADPDRTRTIVAGLAAQQDVMMILGPLGQATSQAAGGVARDVGMPLISLTSAEGVEQLGPTVARARLSPEAQARTMARVAAGDLERRRAALAFPDSPYGRSCAEAFARSFEEAGGRVIAYESYRPRSTRLTDLARRLAGKRKRTKRPDWLKPDDARRRDFDTLFVPDEGQQVVQLLPFLVVEGIALDRNNDVQLLGTAAWDSPALRNDRGLVGGALIPLVLDVVSDNPDAVDAFEVRHGRAPTGFEVQLHDSVLLAEMLLRRCGSLTRRACVIQQMRQRVRVEGLVGPVTLLPSGVVKRGVVLKEL